MRLLGVSVCAWAVAAVLATAAEAQQGELQVEIHHPAPELVLPELQPTLDVEGGASVFGGVRQLDLFLVLDSSKSLRKTDPKDYRSAGAIGLVRHLPAKSDLQIGVVDVDGSAELVAPLTADRNAVVRALRGLDQTGLTDLADGIRTALAGFEERARPGSTRVMLLFTDGKSNEKKARQAMEEARRRGVAIHTLLLGEDTKGNLMLREIADGTGGSFLRVTDPASLPQAFLDLRTTGVERVVLRANGSPPIPTSLVGGTFRGRVPLQPGENRIVAEATSTDGRTREASVRVMVSGPLAVRIDSPVDGTLYNERLTEVEVEGAASAFAQLAPPSGTDRDDPEPGVGDHGIAQVLLRVGDSPPFATTLENGRFRGRVMLRDGENRILATARGHDGRVADAVVTVTNRSPGCAELEVAAQRDGRPALSISDRAVEVVFDASGSMWGQIQGRSKMSIAKGILEEALDTLPEDLLVALRVYGHQHPKERRNCTDSELLVGFEPGNRARIRDAIASFKPRGQTPLGYSLEQLAGDFGGFQGERAVVLVTDGIESCGGDPVAAARALQRAGSLPVHVIGFGLSDRESGDPASLRAIADASGGRFLAARNADELREALSVTVGTAFRVSRNGRTVAEGTLGADEVMQLPEGEYVIHVASAPPRQVPVSLTAEENLTLLLERGAGGVRQRTRTRPAAYQACDAALSAAPREPARRTPPAASEPAGWPPPAASEPAGWPPPAASEPAGWPPPAAPEPAGWPPPAAPRRR